VVALAPRSLHWIIRVWAINDVLTHGDMNNGADSIRVECRSQPALVSCGDGGEVYARDDEPPRLGIARDFPCSR